MATRNIIVQDETAVGSTQNYFDNQYAAEAYISDDVYTAVIGYFELRAYGRLAAENLAGAFIDSCTYEGQDIISTLEQLKLMPDSDQTSIIMFLLNSVRVGTSLLGTTLLKAPNPYTARQIIF
jgi:hypothetical protein